MQGIHGIHQVILEKQESLVEGNAELFESTTNNIQVLNRVTFKNRGKVLFKLPSSGVKSQ